ncbi:MAG TPA: SPFH domain-containing protein [Rhizomicrobium sp.]|nr:SPFH domain-containing protein [Rhizomicrobium sp.]
MNKDINSGGPRPSRPELVPGLAFLLLAAGLAGGALFSPRLPPYLAGLCLEIAAPVVLIAGTFLSTYATAMALWRGVRPRPVPVRRSGKVLHPALERARGHFDRGRNLAANIDWWGDWLPLILILIGAVASLYFEYRGWRPVAGMPSTQADQWIFGCLIGACFPLLVLERKFSAAERLAPSATALSLLLRLLLANLLFFALGFLCRWLQLEWWTILDRVAMLATGLVAAELFLRGVTYFFMPLPPLQSRRGHAESLVAGLLRLERPSLGAISAAISRQVGIDLGRSWALRFIRRAALPALMGLALAGWLMTGITALNLSERAVYEALGRPQAVFHSGLHIHLPWPLGILKPVEYGVIHEIPILFPSESGALPGAETSSGSDVATIEGPPPQTSERLWDASHPSEASYLVASNRNGQETFEVVNIDLQILYRVGLSDQAAYDAVYSVATPDSLIRAAAGRMLARYFARYTIPDVLGQNREKFIQGFQRELQQRLNVLSSGIDILGVVIEAIHPPAAAAMAYQDVQAAGIRSETRVASVRGEAARQVLKSRADAETMRAGAAAASAEMVNQAKVDTALFAGDVTAYRQDGAAFLFERRLQSVGKALRPDMQVNILDSRIPANQMPTLDLRSGTSSGGAANTPPPTPGDDDEK